MKNTAVFFAFIVSLALIPFISASEFDKYKETLEFSFQVAASAVEAGNWKGKKTFTATTNDGAVTAAASIDRIKTRVHRDQWDT